MLLVLKQHTRIPYKFDNFLNMNLAWQDAWKSLYSSHKCSSWVHAWLQVCIHLDLTTVSFSGSTWDSSDVRVPNVFRVSDLYLSTMAVASSTNPSKYTPLGCKSSAQQGFVHGHDRSNFPPILRENDSVHDRELTDVTWLLLLPYVRTYVLEVMWTYWTPLKFMVCGIKSNVTSGTVHVIHTV